MELCLLFASPSPESILGNGDGPQTLRTRSSNISKRAFHSRDIASDLGWASWRACRDTRVSGGTESTGGGEQEVWDCRFVKTWVRLRQCIKEFKVEKKLYPTMLEYLSRNITLLAGMPKYRSLHSFTLIYRCCMHCTGPLINIQIFVVNCPPHGNRPDFLSKEEHGKAKGTDHTENDSTDIQSTRISQLSNKFGDTIGYTEGDEASNRTDQNQNWSSSFRIGVKRVRISKKNDWDEAKILCRVGHDDCPWRPSFRIRACSSEEDAWDDNDDDRNDERDETILGFRHASFPFSKFSSEEVASISKKRNHDQGHSDLTSLYVSEGRECEIVRWLDQNSSIFRDHDDVYSKDSAVHKDNPENVGEKDALKHLLPASDEGFPICRTMEYLEVILDCSRLVSNKIKDDAVMRSCSFDSIIAA